MAAENAEKRKRPGRRAAARRPSVVFKVHFSDHPRLGKVRPVAIEGLDRPRRADRLDPDAVILALRGTLEFAAKAAAGYLVDYDDFENDEEYLHRITAVANRLMPSDVEIVPESIGLPKGTRRTRFDVRGMDSSQREWSGTALGTVPAEAKLRARLAMALSERPRPRDIDGLVDSMWRSWIDSCVPAARKAPDGPRPRF